MDFVCFDNLYKPVKPGSDTLIKDNDILYIHSKDVRYVKGSNDLSNSLCSQIMLYNGEKFYVALSVEDIMKKLDNY